MKPRIWYVILVGIFMSFTFFSCKTTDTGAPASLVDGPAAVQQDLTGPADEASFDALAEAAEKAKEARSMAEYVNGPVHCPNEWRLAESRFTAAGNRKDQPETKEDAYARVAEWNAIKLAYDEIYKKSLDQFVNEQQEVLAKARGRAVEAGAEDILPDRLAETDIITNKSKELSENGDIQGSINAGKEAWDRYRILETLALARSKQLEADDYNFYSVDPNNYRLASEAGDNAVDLLKAGDLVNSQEEATAALNGFREVIRNGWRPIVDEKTSSAMDSRAAAQEIKANVAVKSDFAAAEAVFNQAHVALRAEQYPEAIELFEQSEGLFDIAYDNALIKRSIAEQALQSIDEKLAESEEFAQYVEEIIGGDE